MDSWLRVVAIGLPPAGALIIWRLGDRFVAARSWLAAAIFTVVGLLALVLFVFNRLNACTFASGSQNCAFDGLATLSVVVLGALLAWASIAARRTQDRQDYVLMLVFMAAWAGVGLARELFTLIVSLNVLIFVANRWLNRRGFKLRYLFVRDDYKDE